jgi:hypothetical protein
LLDDEDLHRLEVGVPRQPSIFIKPMRLNWILRGMMSARATTSARRRRHRLSTAPMAIIVVTSTSRVIQFVCLRKPMAYPARGVTQVTIPQT